MPPHNAAAALAKASELRDTMAFLQNGRLDGVNAY
jgi:hypothetical protein